MKSPSFLLFPFLLLFASAAMAQESQVLNLHCEGLQEDFTATYDSPQGKKSTQQKTFSVRIAPATGWAQVTGLTLYGAIAQDPPYKFQVSDSSFIFQVEWSSSQPKSHMTTVLNIDRYSGVARENQVVMSVGEKSYLAQTLKGEYKCSVLKDKLF